jgi:hypothetical protein
MICYKDNKSRICLICGDTLEMGYRNFTRKESYTSLTEDVLIEREFRTMLRKHSEYHGLTIEVCFPDIIIRRFM